jgi:hypothetical protein
MFENLMPLGIFCTFPQPFLSTLGGFIDQIVGTAILMAGIFAIGDDDNKTIDEGTPSTHYNLDSLPNIHLLNLLLCSSAGKPFAVALLVVNLPQSNPPLIHLHGPLPLTRLQLEWRLALTLGSTLFYTFYKEIVLNQAILASKNPTAFICKKKSLYWC